MNRRRGIAVLAAVVLVAGACSDRGDDPSGSDDAAGSVTTTSVQSAGGDTFGDLGSPCGDTPSDVPTDTSAADDDAQGITDDAIAVGTIADPGFSARPGLNQEIFDAGEAFVAWCNEQGGINGRQLDLTQRDAAYTEYQARLEEACAEDFAIVGDGAVQDNLWADIGVGCGLVDIAGFSVTPEKSGSAGADEVERPRAVQPLPNPNDL